MHQKETFTEKATRKGLDDRGAAMTPVAEETLLVLRAGPEMRGPRNAIAHEYWTDRAQLAEMFAAVAGFSRRLLDTVTRLDQYAPRFPHI